MIQPGSPIEYITNQRSGFFTTDLQIYCYPGTSKSLSAVFQSINVELHLDNDDFVWYEGATQEIVRTHYDNQRSIFSFNFLNTRKRKLINLNPFNQTCVGIETAHPYKISLNLIRIDFWKVVLMALGLLLFFAASQFSETPVFYYTTGILLGIVASLLIVVYFLAKLFPKKPMMYSVMAGGSALAVYFTQLLWDNVQVILFNYQTYVFWYIVVTGFISFVICYRLGPPKNQRSKNLIKWGLQIVAVIMIYFSSQFQEASVGVILLTIVIYYFPVQYLYVVRRYWRRKFPPRIRLLTNEEYYEQTARETTKALDELKRFCSSPESQPWRTMTKLKDPRRFASFMEGQPHLLDSEILEYESLSHISNTDISNDEEDDESEEEAIHMPTPLRQTFSGRMFGREPSSARTSTPILNGRVKHPLNGIEISDDDE
ncbi:Nuclear envelope integral membrane protein 1b [Pseudolycoriella hygida]|uniref:Nuclear envelope integral membrane protein 1b n=1 Tax=Pseudolycoriella hygida TaxID=35572 RepID=A0A9Q0S0B0_9DIPT|nr:Nuclear envelope integral membrane protein 1b [Pseudolycoriella hygida]KAJ6639091.1 Nuclear envelope integral membrane protein 1b [Pseudolycoriella hygida]